MEIEKDHKHCFGCGTDNPEGLGLSFENDTDGVSAGFTPRAEHQSYKGIVHGGIIGAVLDEAMGYALGHQGINGMTAEYTVRLKGTLSPGQETEVRAKVTQRGRKIVRTEAYLFEKENNNVIATAKGTFIRTDEADGS